MNDSINSSTTQSSPVIRYAGFWVRFAAGLVDALIISGSVAAIFFLLMFFLVQVGILSFDERGREPFAVYLDWVLPAMLILSSCFYQAILLASSKRATWGKRLMGIQVVSVEGSRLSLARAFWRASAFELISFFHPINLLILVLNKKKQGLHDRLAGTYVIYKPVDQK